MAATEPGRADLLIGIEDRLPWWQCAWYGIQQLTVDGTAIVIPVVIGGALHLTPPQTAHVVQASLIGAGLVTLGQSLLSLRLPVLQGPATVFVAIMATVAAGYGLPAAWTAMFVAGLIVAALAWPLRLWSRLRPVFAAAPVYGTFLVLVSLVIGGVLMGDIVGKPGGPGFGGGLDFVLAALPLLAALVLMLVVPRSIWRYSSILIGAIAAVLIAAVFGRVDFASVGGASWLGVPRLLPFGFQLNGAAILIVFVGYFANLFEVVGTYVLVGEVIGGQRMEAARIDGGILTESLGSAIAGLFGGCGTITYMQNTGALALTGVGSRFVFAASGVILLILGFVPKVGAIAADLPAPVVGGLLLATVAMLFMQGVRVLGRMPSTNLNLMSAGVGILVGASWTAVPAPFFALLPAWAKPFLTSGLIVGLFVSVVLYVVFGPLLHLDRSDAVASGEGGCATAGNPPH